jgi:hypothetical protein
VAGGGRDSGLFDIRCDKGNPSLQECRFHLARLFSTTSVLDKNQTLRKIYHAHSKWALGLVENLSTPSTVFFTEEDCQYGRRIEDHQDQRSSSVLNFRPRFSTFKVPTKR